MQRYLGIPDKGIRVNRPTRRSLLKSMVAAGAAPWFVPAHVLGATGQTAPSNKITLGVIGVGAQGQYDMRNFPVPDYVDWNRWVGPAPLTPFHEEKLRRDNHENISNFSLGMISCWGIHHLDIAQWGNGTDATGPCAVEGKGEFPKEGSFDAIWRWRVRFEYASAAPVTFVSDGTEGYTHGVRFIGESAWVHVRRGRIEASDDGLLRDAQKEMRHDAGSAAD